MKRRGKRRLGPPTGNTPGKPDKKSLRHEEQAGHQHLSSRKSLFEETTETNKPEWSYKELKGLVQHVALYNENSNWPTHKNVSFWDECVRAVSEFSGMPSRTGNACRMKVIKGLKKDFKTINEAEEAYGIDYFENEEHGDSDTIDAPLPDSPLSRDIINNIVDNLGRLSPQQRIKLATHIYSFVAENDFDEDLKYFIPANFIELSLCATSYLKKNGKDNVIYDLCKCLGVMREDGSSARMDVSKMPFGLISYNCKFFAVDDGSNLHVPEDYMQWMESMYSYFGNSWASLHLGPMWSYENEVKEKERSSSGSSNIIAEALASAFQELSIPEFSAPSDTATPTDSLVQTPVMPSTKAISPTMLNPKLIHEHHEDSVPSISASTFQPSTLWSALSDQEIEEMIEAEASPQEIATMFDVKAKPKKESRKRKTMDAKVNVAGPSARSIRRHIADSGFSCDTHIQVEALKKAHEANPMGRWFIKADATDMKMGLRESMQGKWTGDCDLGDGELQKTKQKYDEQLVWIRGLGLRDRKGREEVVEDLKELTHQLSEHVEFLTNGFNNAKKSYKTKKQQKSVPEQTLFALAWTVEGFEKLLESNAKLTSSVNDLVTLMINPVKEINLPRKLSRLRKDLEDYFKGIISKKRDAASHLLVFMISDELRSKKPYAIPVRVLPYSNITDGGLRKLRDEVKEDMSNIGMVTVGFSTDGEFNSLRTRGSKRPISIIQLMMDARANARSMSVKVIEKFLQPVRGNDGNIHPHQCHPAVPLEDIQWLYDFMHNAGPSKISFNQALFILRRKQFPFLYDPWTWIQGKDETLNDVLKSMMALYIYRQSVLEYTRSGVNFKEHLYVPEVDEKTGEHFHEREDHNHVLKRITACTRAASIPDVDLRAFVECLNASDSGLTYTALTGQHKQSVPDCERMFSRGVLEFLERNNFPKEARFVRLVRDWHKASDGRGLSEETRSKFNVAMLDFILEDWMPWYWFMRDYSVMDVNRPVKGIKGLTREVIVALVANIESQEQRRLDYQERNLPPEHPRASATDDLEGFFSILHQLLGPTFDHKTFVDNYRKIEQEFVKRVDPDLKFHYWTGINERYNVGLLKSFNDPTDGTLERLDQICISRRADPGVFVANRASIPQKGSLTVRAQFHVKPEALPPRVLDNGS